MTRYRLQLVLHDSVDVSADGSLQLYDRCLEYAQQCGFGVEARVATDQTHGAFAVFVGGSLAVEGTLDLLDGTA